MCMGMGCPFPWDWNPMGMGTQHAKIGMGMGRVRVTMGMGMATFHVCQNTHLSTRCEWNPMKCNVTSLFCEQMYVCMLYVWILRPRQLSVCILNISHRLIIQ